MAKQVELFDYIVIGGGSAGCVVAGRLSEDPAVKVLLLERGSDVNNDRCVATNDYNQVLPVSPIEFLPVETLVTRETKLMAGLSRTYVPKALGGGPAVSGSFWGRGDCANYDEWSLLGNKGWSYQEVLPYFQRSESYRELFHPDRPVSPDRGVDGPIKIGKHNDSDPILQLLLATASRAFNVPIIDDYNTSRGLRGFAAMQRSLGHDIGQPKRSTTYKSYIEPYLATRPNLHLIDMATVVRIHFDAESGRAHQVEYLHQGSSRYAAIGAEVILAAGTINSAKILLQSGVGDARELAAIGIKTVIDLPGVGKNLQDHIYLPFSYQTNPHTIAPIDAPSPVMIGFFPSPDAAEIDLELTCGIVPNGILRGFLINLRNQARGSLRLASPDPLAPPYLEFNWDPYSQDMEKLAGAFQQLRKWLADSEIVMREIQPGLDNVPVDADIRQWQQWFAREMKGFFHMAGTCKMAPQSDPLAVVDNRLRLYGAPNLRVADCSIMPRLIASHPSATAVMIGEKLADMIKGAD